MANVFTGTKTEDVGTAGSIIYTHPAPSTATDVVVVGLLLTNILANQITVSIQLDTGGAYLVKDIPIPAGASLDALAGKLVLDQTDHYNLVATASENTAVDAVVSVLEIT
jgi:hypothetical protein